MALSARTEDRPWPAAVTTYRSGRSPLPAIPEPLFLEFDFAPGYDSGDPFATPIVQRDGRQANSANGIEINVAAAQASSITALAVYGFSGIGIYASADFVSVQGCLIGVRTGTSAQGNGNHGLRMSGNDTIVGQSFNASSGWIGNGNVISKNSGYGLVILGDDALSRAIESAPFPPASHSSGTAPTGCRCTVLGPRSGLSGLSPPGARREF